MTYHAAIVLKSPLPSGFPDTQFEALKDRIVVTLPNPSRDLEEIGGAHNAVRFRLRACADYSEEFLQSLRRRGTAPTLKDRYQQERELFGFFVSGIATLDSFSYFLYLAAAQINAAAFRSQTRRDLSSITLKKPMICSLPISAGNL